MFIFDPMTEEEIKSMNLMDEGEYSFEVYRATQKTSQSGNPMIELQLKIWDKSGSARIIFDYLVSCKSTMYKIKHFCDSVGLQEEYKSGSFDASILSSRFGVAHIVIKKGQQKPDGGVYADKNAVQDYIIKTDIKTTKHNTSDFDDAVIPF